MRFVPRVHRKSIINPAYEAEGKLDTREGDKVVEASEA